MLFQPSIGILGNKLILNLAFTCQLNFISKKSFNAVHERLLKLCGWWPYIVVFDTGWMFCYIVSYFRAYCEIGLNMNKVLFFSHKLRSWESTCINYMHSTKWEFTMNHCNLSIFSTIYDNTKVKDTYCTEPSCSFRFFGLSGKLFISPCFCIKHIREYWEILAALTNSIYCNPIGALMNRFPVMVTPIGWREFPTIFWSVLSTQ